MTILEQIKAKYPNAEGIDDARNIAEAMACVSGTGGRGAGAIADHILEGESEVPSLSTVLFEDNTLIINELGENRSADITLHGSVMHTYPPLSEEEPYVFRRSYNPMTGEFSDPDVLWYEDRDSIGSVEFGSEIYPTNMNYWFMGCENLEQVNFTNLDTSDCTSMTSLFDCCYILTSLDMTTLNTLNVTNMDCMFNHCHALSELLLDGLDTSNVRYMDNMFFMCTDLTEINLSSFNTSNVEFMDGMFSGCASLTGLDLSSFYTVLVTTFVNFANGCTSLTSVTFDPSSFVTQNVTSFEGMFYGCSSLTEIDISSFTRSSESVGCGYMFYGCGQLVTITASENFGRVDSMEGDGMFSECVSLVGGNGTVYSEEHTDGYYARIDTADTPGYFTAASA